jgi:VanZ family protein
MIFSIITVVIILSSLKNADLSLKDSDLVTDVIVQIGGKKDKNIISSFVRDVIGHFGSFFLCGIFSFLTIKSFLEKKKNSMILIILIGIVLSVGSELLQLIPKGRHCDYKDMLVNISGYISSILIYLIISFIKVKSKKEKSLF